MHCKTYRRGGRENYAPPFTNIIEKVSQFIIPSITLTAVFKCIHRQCDEDTALEDIAHMEQGRVISLDSSIAFDAAYYGYKI